MTGKPCKKIKYVKKECNKLVLKPQKKPCKTESRSELDTDTELPQAEDDEGEGGTIMYITKPPKHPLDLLKLWVQKQRFIPQDLTHDFLALFLSAADYSLKDTKKALMKYFYSRQEPSVFFRERDPLCYKNIKIFEKVYVLPLPETTGDGCKIILTGLVTSTTTYNQIDHIKAFLMVMDLLIWDKDLGYGEYLVVFNGTGFQCPQLLENRIRNHREISEMLKDTIPAKLRGVYLMYPPQHISTIVSILNGIRINVIRSKSELISILPRDMLPLEYGGNLGHLNELLEQWKLRMADSRSFFINFESKMKNDYRRRQCYETEVKKGKNWISQMQLEADEWEYKTEYYKKLRDKKPLTHPAFGKSRLEIKAPKAKSIKPKPDPVEKCRKLAKEEQEKAEVFEPTNLYHGWPRSMLQSPPRTCQAYWTKVSGDDTGIKNQEKLVCHVSCGCHTCHDSNNRGHHCHHHHHAFQPFSFHLW